MALAFRDVSFQKSVKCKTQTLSCVTQETVPLAYVPLEPVRTTFSGLRKKKPTSHHHSGPLICVSGILQSQLHSNYSEKTGRQQGVPTHDWNRFSGVIWFFWSRHFLMRQELIPSFYFVDDDAVVVVVVVCFGRHIVVCIGWRDFLYWRQMSFVHHCHSIIDVFVPW